MHEIFYENRLLKSFLLFYFAIQSTFKMKNKEQYVNEIKAIRQMMEQSSRFLSLSGLSGILIGIYAIIGAYVAHYLIKGNSTEFIRTSNIGGLVWQLVILAIVVLAVSIVTVVILTYRKTVLDGFKIWNKGTRLLILNMAVPLVSGGILTSIFVVHGLYETVAPALLVFYGLALVNSAKYTRQEIYYMGLCQIVTGIIAALLPNYALLLWAIGFGLIHIFYGTVMHFRYDHHSKTKKP